MVRGWQSGVGAGQGRADRLFRRDGASVRTGASAGDGRGQRRFDGAVACEFLMSLADTSRGKEIVSKQVDRQEKNKQLKLHLKILLVAVLCEAYFFWYISSSGGDQDRRHLLLMTVMVNYIGPIAIVALAINIIIDLVRRK
jgi:hypothetical protein